MGGDMLRRGLGEGAGAAVRVGVVPQRERGG